MTAPLRRVNNSLIYQEFRSDFGDGFPCRFGHFRQDSLRTYNLGRDVEQSGNLADVFLGKSRPLRPIVDRLPRDAKLTGQPGDGAMMLSRPLFVQMLGLFDGEVIPCEDRRPEFFHKEPS